MHQNEKYFEMGVILKVGVILKTIKDLKSRQTKQLLYLPGIKDHLTYEEAAELIFNEAKLIAGTENLFCMMYRDDDHREDAPYFTVITNAWQR